MERPISWYCGPFPNGPSSRKRNLQGQEVCQQRKRTERRAEGGSVAAYLVGTGTSVRPVSSTAGQSRTKAMMGRSRKSTSPTRTLEASAP